MNPNIAALTDKIRALEAELEAELAKTRADLRIGLEKGRAVFEEELLRRHREMRTRLSAYVLNAHPLIILTAPVIYALIVPLVLLDVSSPSIRPFAFPFTAYRRSGVAIIWYSTATTSRT
jgi:hypothetical protein